MKLPERWKRERTASLAALGMQAYMDYLTSPLWGSIRRRVYARAHGVCEAKGCSNVPSAVHHWSYAFQTMCGATLAHLRALCEPCHRRAHSIPKPNQRKLAARVRRKAKKAWMKSGGALGQPTTAQARLVKPEVE